MKIIDLLNKKVSGEKLPKFIKYNDEVWMYANWDGDYQSEDDGAYLLKEYQPFEMLNDEIEIIEDLPDMKMEEYQKALDETTSEKIDLENIIKEAIEYIKEKYDYLLKDETFLDHDERIDSKQIKHILEILDKGEE